ncbi:hypothetical protein F511_42824 [Dorcoceras hygrometricum]|uniref:Uncharacterized protein n=1 Tax=Dorcoceras hygrometricum TaxID=472368 RepID=A0A2Z7AEZ2_9LAMI|nr:hypothetical protein F511_42824 [Dorcoceras hygrometricum]
MRVRYRRSPSHPDSEDALCVEIQQSQDTSWKHMFNTIWTTRRKQQQHPVVSYNESVVAIYPVASYSGSSRELQCYCISSRHGIPDARKAEVAKRCNPDARFQSQYLKIRQKRKAAVDLNQQQSS